MAVEHHEGDSGVELCKDGTQTKSYQITGLECSKPLVNNIKNTTIYQENPAMPNCNNLCNRIRSLTPDVLTAPVEKPYEVVVPTREGAIGRPSLGREVRCVIGNVREFFEELRRQLGESCQGTLFNSTAQLTALACGVSINTVYRAGPIREPLRTKNEQFRARKERVNRRWKETASLKKFGKEWGDVVRHFVRSELEVN
ncbi:unnamed protein product, partial [Strongylus vulgaris]